MNSCKVCLKETKNKTYCGIECQKKGYKIQKVERVEVKCKFCLSSIKKIPSKVRTNNYCSRICSDNDKKNTMSGVLNHRYGTKASEETKQKKSIIMKKKWKEAEYKEKRSLSLEKCMEGREYWFGNTPENIEKRKKTILEKYGKHPFSDEEYRKKCDEKCLQLYGKTSIELAKAKIDKEIIEKRRKSLIETIMNIPYEEYEKRLSKKEKYYKIVRRITESQDLSKLENFDKRGRGTEEGVYHLDHIIPISYGLINNIDPAIIGHISNLRFIPALENIKKGASYGQEN